MVTLTHIDKTYAVLPVNGNSVYDKIKRSNLGDVDMKVLRLRMTSKLGFTFMLML